MLDGAMEPLASRMIENIEGIQDQLDPSDLKQLATAVEIENWKKS